MGPVEEYNTRRGLNKYTSNITLYCMSYVIAKCCTSWRFAERYGRVLYVMAVCCLVLYNMTIYGLVFYAMALCLVLLRHGGVLFSIVCHERG